MFTRRGLFKLVLGAIVGSRVQVPTFRRSDSFAFFSGEDVTLERIPIRKMMARIRITEEVIKSSTREELQTFFKNDVDQSIRDIQRREQAALVASGRER